MTKRKKQILDEVLEHAAFDGWNQTALNNAAKKVCGDKKYARIEFPNGIHDLSEYFSDICNAEMTERIKKLDLDSMKVRERIKAAIVTRLEIYQPHKEAIHSIISRRVMPDGLWQSINDVGNTVSEMWYVSGDSSTDYNYYSKRFILGGVYTSTLMFWLQDKSKDFEETKKFLDRRIENVMQFEKLKGKVLDTFDSFIPHK